MAEAVNEQQARLLQGLEGCPSHSARAGLRAASLLGAAGTVAAARPLWQGGTRGGISSLEEHETKAVFAQLLG